MAPDRERMRGGRGVRRRPVGGHRTPPPRRRDRIAGLYGSQTFSRPAPVAAEPQRQVRSLRDAEAAAGWAMSVVTATEVRLFLLAYLRRTLASHDRAVPDDLPENYDLLLSGVIDSLGLLDLVSALGSHFNREITFAELDPEQVTIV